VVLDYSAKNSVRGYDLGMGRPPGYDRREVLAALERQFRKTGYEGTSLDDICAATGLGRGSLYAAFGDKHTMFMAALGDYCDQAEAAQAAALHGPDETAMDRLRAFLTRTIDDRLADPDHLGCMVSRFAVEVGGRDAQATDRLRRGYELMRDALAECVRAAQRHGDVDPAASPCVLANLLIAQNRGLEVLMGIGLERAELMAAVDAALAGLLAPPPTSG